MTPSYKTYAMSRNLAGGFIRGKATRLRPIADPQWRQPRMPVIRVPMGPVITTGATALLDFRGGPGDRPSTATGWWSSGSRPPRGHAGGGYPGREACPRKDLGARSRSHLSRFRGKPVRVRSLQWPDLAGNHLTAKAGRVPPRRGRLDQTLQSDGMRFTSTMTRGLAFVHGQNYPANDDRHGAVRPAERGVNDQGQGHQRP